MQILDLDPSLLVFAFRKKSRGGEQVEKMQYQFQAKEYKDVDGQDKEKVFEEFFQFVKIFSTRGPGPRPRLIWEALIS